VVPVAVAVNLWWAARKRQEIVRNANRRLRP
jgi:hypothetical protein